jgi:hypothetical protein
MIRNINAPLALTLALTLASVSAFADQKTVEKSANGGTVETTQDTSKNPISGATTSSVTQETKDSAGNTTAKKAKKAKRGKEGQLLKKTTDSETTATTPAAE